MNPSITDKAAKGWFLGKICDATIETGSLTCDAQLEIIDLIFDAELERCTIRAHMVMLY